MSTNAPVIERVGVVGVGQVGLGVVEVCARVTPPDPSSLTGSRDTV